MSLKTALQNCAAEAGIRRPDSFVGSADEDALRLLNYARRTAHQIADHHPNGWGVLQREHSFVTTAAEAYALPADYERIISDTAWNESTYWQVRGPHSPQRWREIRSGLVQNAGVTDFYRLKFDDASGEKRFFLDPAPTAGETLLFEYVTNELWESAGGTGMVDPTADTDIFRVDEYLLELGVTYRLLRRLGLAYLEERRDFDMALDMRVARDAGSGKISLDGPAPLAFVANIQEGNFG